MKMHILLPAFNEKPALSILIPKIADILKGSYSIVIVDDGSDDGTGNISVKLQEKYPIVYLKHEKNKGLGLSVVTGLKYIIENSDDSDLLIIMDADNTQDPVYINDMLAKIADNDIVIASRYINSGTQVGVKWYRKVLSFLAYKLFSAVYRIENVRDYMCAYRMYKIKLLKEYNNTYNELPAAEKGFTVMVEILLKLVSIGAKCTEIPFVLRYDLKNGKSKIKIIPTIYDYILLIFKSGLSAGKKNNE